MKVWELEEGKEYVSKSNMRFKVNGGILKYYDEYYPSWCLSHLEYNDVMDMDFTEYTPPTDWSKVEVDTKVLVKEDKYDEWNKRYFARYEKGKVWTWCRGATSFTAEDENDTLSWNYAKLYKEE